MKALRKYLGIVWLLLGPGSILFLAMQAAKKLSMPTSTVNDTLQWSIIIGIFVPIAFGLMIFGWYALQGEYDEAEA
jgi:purine-cytosine permease-like protein